MDFVAIDFETAMEKHWSACAIAIVPVKNGIIGETIYRLIRPPELKFGHIQIGKHGITANDVKDAPTLDQLWPEISHHIMGTLVIAHCAASADISILRQSLEAVGVPVPRLSYLCSRDLSKKLWPNLPNHKLDTLCEFHSIPLEHHHAGSDAHAAAQLILLGFKKQGVNCPYELAMSCGVSLGELISDDNRTTCQSLSGNEATSSQPADRDECQESLLVYEEVTRRTRRSRTKSDRPEICFSGFSKSEKESLEAFAEKHGYTYKDTVTANLEILVKGSNVGPSKLKKAQTQGCLILTEPEFRNLVESFPTEQWWKV